MNTFIATVFLQKKNYVHIKNTVQKYVYIVTQILSSERTVHIAT